MEGDGIGPEITAATLEGVLRAAERVFALGLSFAPVTVGFAALRAHGSTLPDAAAEAAKSADGSSSARSRTTTIHRWRGRAQPVRRIAPPARPVRQYPAGARRGGSPPRCGSPIDLVIVRENTEGFYADRSMFLGTGEFMPTPDLALSVRKITREGSTRIAEAAFALAAAAATR